MISEREPPSMASAGRRDLSHLPISLYQFCTSVPPQRAPLGGMVRVALPHSTMARCAMRTLTRLDGQQMMAF